MDTPDEPRTHGEHSTVNDTMEGADTSAGTVAIGRDIPQSPHGDVPLEYTEQNFNALVAANTAMISENNAAQEKVVHLAQVIEDQRARMAEMAQTAKTYEEHAERFANLAQERKTDLDEARSELIFARDQRDELQRKVDRMSGYLDRVLDDEDSIRAPETRQAPAPKPAVGPDLECIPRAVKRTARGDTDMPYAFSTKRLDEIQGFASVQRPRRY